MLTNMDLSELEKRVVEHLVAGTELDLAAGVADGELGIDAMREWGSDREISAEFLREVLRCRYVAADSVDPRGLRLRGVRVVGMLNLDRLTTPIALSLRSCHLRGGFSGHECEIPGLDVAHSLIETGRVGQAEVVHLVRARITGGLVMSGATLMNDAGIALAAAGMIVGGTAALDDGFVARGSSERGAVRLVGARIGGRLVMSGATLSNNSGPAMVADELAVDGRVFLNAGFSATGRGEDGAVRLVGGHIGGRLDMGRATLVNATGYAIVADELVVDGGAFFHNGYAATGSGSTGAMSLVGARIGGRLVMNQASITCDNGPAVNAFGVVVDGSVFMSDGFSATGSTSLGSVIFMAARVKGTLILSGATLSNPFGPALNADGMLCEGAFLDNGFTATGRGEVASVRLVGAQIDGPLVMKSATLTNKTGPALTASRINVRDDLDCNDGFTAEGGGLEAAVDLTSGRIGGHLFMTDAAVTNPTGHALNGSRLTVQNDAYLNGAFEAQAGGSGLAVSLINAHVAGRFVMAGATLISEAGGGLVAFGMTTDSGMSLSAGFTATGASERALIDLAGTRIKGDLNMAGAELNNSLGTALDVSEAVVASVILDGGFMAFGAGEEGTVRLVRAHLRGQLHMGGATVFCETGSALVADGMVVDDHVFLDRGFTVLGIPGAEDIRLANGRIRGYLGVSEPSVSQAIWDVDGLVYEGYRGVGFDNWLELLKNGTPEYRSQPYQQLAAVARTAGHDGESRRALIAQRNDQLKRGGLPLSSRAWARVTKATVGFGYQPWRALFWALLLLAIAMGIAFFVPGALVDVGTGDPCTAVKTIQVAVDMVIPLVKTSVGTDCRVSSSAGGQLVGSLGVGLSLLGWALTALFAAGFTSAIRKP